MGVFAHGVFFPLFGEFFWVWEAKQQLLEQVTRRFDSRHQEVKYSLADARPVYRAQRSLNVCGDLLSVQIIQEIRTPGEQPLDGLRDSGARFLPPFLVCEEIIDGPGDVSSRIRDAKLIKSFSYNTLCPEYPVYGPAERFRQSVPQSLVKNRV